MAPGNSLFGPKRLLKYHKYHPWEAENEVLPKLRNPIKKMF